MRRALNDGGTYFVSNSSFIRSHMSIGGRPRVARLFSKLVQYWLAWPDSFFAAYLTFLGLVISYHVKHLWVSNLWKVVGCDVHQVGDINLDIFQILSIGLGGLSILLHQFFLGGVWLSMGDSGDSCVAFTLVNLSLNVLRVSNLAFISANIIAIC